MQLKKFVLLISIILVGVGVGGAIYFTYFAGSYTIKAQTLTSADGTELASWVYTPKNLAGTVPGIVVCHGFTSNKQTMQGISIELVKCGFVVVAIDFRGHGQSGGNLGEERNLYGEENKLVDDVHAAVQYLQNLPYVNNNSIGLVGHSMGGASVMGTALTYPTEINATVSIGMVGINDSRYEINGANISNLLIAMGGLEELFTEAQALAFLRNATGGIINPVVAGETYGNFTYGNATRLIIDPLADHILEISSSTIIAETCVWFLNSFDPQNTHQTADLQITNNWRQIFIILAVFGSFLGFFVFVPYMKPIFYKNRTQDLHKVEDPNPKKKLLIYIGGYCLINIIAFLLLSPMAAIFSQSINLIMSNYLLGLFVGFAIGLFIVFYLIHRYVDRDQRSYLRRIKDEISHNFNQSVLFGTIIFLYSFGSLTAILHWSFFDLLPTTREIGTTIVVALMIFPYIFLDQLYIRNMQALVPPGRIKELLKMIVLSSIAKLILFIPILFIDLGFASLVILILVIAFPFLEILGTWIYIYSGRNIISPTIYLTFILSWFLVALMPFGNYSYSIL
ncbi:MAG: alpha/beta hydrolase [Candidatus Helarchaeota archaeon]